MDEPNRSMTNRRGAHAPLGNAGPAGAGIRCTGRWAGSLAGKSAQPARRDHHLMSARKPRVPNDNTGCAPDAATAGCHHHPGSGVR